MEHWDASANAGAALGLPPDHYHDPARHGADLDRIFGHSWVFVGLSDEVASDNDYLTRTIGDTDVLVHRFDGELRAFLNVCSHRFGRIHPEAFGSRPLRCQYHGWTYDRDGVPVGIPGNDAHFRLGPEDRRARALRRFACAEAGRFIFVRLAPGGPNLADWLGDAGDLLQHLSEVFGPPFERRGIPWDADWKMGVESVLETYHAPTTHADTFAKLVGRTWTCRYHGRHSYGLAPLSDASKRWWQSVGPKLALAPSPRLTGYDHYLLFPNLALGITAGSLLSIQTYDPAGPGRSALNLRLCFADRAGGTGNQAVRRHVAETACATNFTLLEEDRVATEGAARGARQGGFRALLGTNEDRIRHFHARYLDAIGDAP